jgi:uncharacterized protein
LVGKLNKQEIEELLAENVFGHLGCSDAHDSYVYPSNYLYDGKQIICHSQDGFKNRVMRTNKRVCFQVDVITDHSNWKSVMIHGEYEEIHDHATLKKFINAFFDRRLFIKKDQASMYGNTKKTGTDSEPTNAIIFRIVIDEKTGRFEQS